MKVHELLTFNREILLRMHRAGIRADDYRYADLYTEYESRASAGEKVTYIVSCLATKYGVSERQIYNLLDKLGKEISYCKSGSVE